VSLTVTDQGEGMDAATLSRAMDPFFTTKGVGKGTGLGLPMVHGLAVQSGGRLRLLSRKGRGTTAELLIPVATDTTVAIPSDGTATAPPESDRQALVIVAVDDDALVLMNTVAMLEDLGHRVHEAHSGEEALAVLKREPHVDLVVTDQAMPRMTGLQLAEAIEAAWPRLPVLIATGYAELPPTTRQLQKIAKPFTQHELSRAVTAIVSSGGVRNAAVADAAPQA
jgi:CheY-like chemotaxis protein